MTEVAPTGQTPTARTRTAGMGRDLARWYRRSGGDLPGSDPRPSHGAEMEGYLWRFTDAAARRVVVALCGVNRHPEGDWATVAVAVHPGGVTRSAVVADAVADRERYAVRAGDALVADETGVRVRLDGVELDATLHETRAWPLRLGGGGIFGALPVLGQYWHPHVLGGRAEVTWVVDGERTRSVDADVYAEKNWGAGFPDRWWWGQAQGFDRPDVCVAFGGGRLSAGPVAVDVTGVVVRIGDRVVRVAPPAAWVRTDVADGRWRIDARHPAGWRVRLDGRADATPPHVLPVPLPAERRNVDRDLEHLAGRLDLRVERWGRPRLVATSTLAALEVGSVDPDEADRLRTEFGVP